MVSISLLALSGALACVASALPATSTTTTTATVTTTATSIKSSTVATTATSTKSSNPSTVTHRVIAGFNGLHFEPENIVAEVGELVEVHFNPMNHSFAQSSFANPCKPINDAAFFSGFMPTNNTEAPNTFTITVQSKEPTWFYCAQTKGSHCQMGMAGVINQNFNSPNTLDAYKKAANLTGVSVAPPRVQGGVVAPSKMKGL